MMDINGDWDVLIRTPMGPQEFLFSVKQDGSSFSGSASGELGSMDFSDGSIDGDEIRWSMRVMKPFPMTLAVRATVEGSQLQGSVDAGMMGTMPLNGTRRA